METNVQDVGCAQGLQSWRRELGTRGSGLVGPWHPFCGVCGLSQRHVCPTRDEMRSLEQRMTRL